MSHKKPFNVDEMFGWVRYTLSRPAAACSIRVQPVGTFVAQFCLPLDLCPGVNAMIGMSRKRLKWIKRRCLSAMLLQDGMRKQSCPLPGRPMVRVIRFSSTQPDNDQAFSKVPVDRLTVGRRKRPKNVPDHIWRQVQERAGPVNLGYLRDDRPADADVRTWWEPAPSGHGCVFVDVWTGETPDLTCLRTYHKDVWTEPFISPTQAQRLRDP